MVNCFLEYVSEMTACYGKIVEAGFIMFPNVKSMKFPNMQCDSLYSGCHNQYAILWK